MTLTINCFTFIEKWHRKGEKEIGKWLGSVFSFNKHIWGLLLNSIYISFNLLSFRFNNTCVFVFSIYPSPEQGQSIPISNSTGSLPDLTNIHFPSPLATPLDAPGGGGNNGAPGDESQYNHHGGNHHGNLSPTAPHHHIGAIRQSATSPSSRRRAMPGGGGGGGGGPQPLVIQGSPTQMRHSMSPQVCVNRLRPVR